MRSSFTCPCGVRYLLSISRHFHVCTSGAERMGMNACPKSLHSCYTDQRNLLPKRARQLNVASAHINFSPARSNVRSAQYVSGSGRGVV